ncbi:unnamed protein product [Adineta steineri]|uniref:Uncharacterized protein n=1 Tax=Adineta steineri TaxID=433720 RepID=A0A813YE06_9BILA|nr:unnamed protein product [Adineta steineri]
MIGAEPSIRSDEILKYEIVTDVVKHLRNLSQPQQLQDNADDNCSYPHAQEQQHNERDGVVLVHEKHFAAAMIGAEPSIRSDEILKYEIVTDVVKHLRNLSQPQQLQDNAGDNSWSKLIW